MGLPTGLTPAAWLLAGLLIVAPLTGCQSPREREVARYVETEYPKFAAQERGLLQAMRTSFHQQQDDAAKRLLFERQLVPMAEQHVAAVEAVKPDTPELAEVHALKLKAARARRDAIVIFGQALAKKDGPLGERARAQYRQADLQQEAFETALEGLRKKPD